MASKKDKKEKKGASTAANIAVESLRQLMAAKTLSSNKLDEHLQQRIAEGAAPWQIVRYRRVIEPSSAPFPLPIDSYVRPKTLEKHLAYLAKHCKPISLSELIDKIEDYQEIPEKSVVVTFDCGHMDNHANALPLLVKHNIPATFFLPTRHTSGGGFLYEDIMAMALVAVKQLDLTLPLFPFLRDDEEFCMGVKEIAPDAQITAESISLLICALRRTTKENRAVALATLSQALEGIAQPPDYGDFMKWNDIQAMQRLGIFSFGTLGHSYSIASDLNEEELVQDILSSFQSFNENQVTMEKVFCFPEGIVTESAINTLAQLQVRFCLSMISEIQPKYQVGTPMVLGRIPISEISAPSTALFASRLWEYDIQGGN